MKNQGSLVVCMTPETTPFAVEKASCAHCTLVGAQAKSVSSVSAGAGDQKDALVLPDDLLNRERCAGAAAVGDRLHAITLEPLPAPADAATSGLFW